MRQTVRQHSFVRIMSVVVLLGAILPNVLYLGHWPIRGVHGTHTHVHSDQQSQSHASHCHYGPASCFDQPLVSTDWWLSDDQWSTLFDNEPQRVESYTDDITLESPVFRLKPPPRYV